MALIQFDLTKSEKAKLERLRDVFNLTGKASVIKRLIKEYDEKIGHNTTKTKKSSSGMLKSSKQRGRKWNKNK